MNPSPRIRIIQASFIALLFTIGLIAETNQETERERINRLSWQEHQLEMKALGIETLRPGPSGDPSAPNAANTDESKANPYSSLPDPLLFDNGSPVENAQDWVIRKKEIFEHFNREIYGYVPEQIPPVVWKQIDGTNDLVDGCDVSSQVFEGWIQATDSKTEPVKIYLELVLPANPTKPVPVVVAFDWSHRYPNIPEGPKPSWKSMVLQQGWGYVLLDPTSYQADNGAGLREGIIGLVNHGEPRQRDQWGVLRAWAWGASRTMDLLEQQPDVDAQKVVIEGLSRYGKAALVTMAYDERFAIGFIGSSGAGGASILRRVFGEQVENLAASGEFHWFASNFLKYAGPLTPNDLPVDAHQLIALCAPRPVFISVGAPDVEGQWVDARGMFLAGVHASPAYELLGKSGIGTKTYPDLKEPLIQGEIAFRQHEGGHTVYPNWPTFIDYAKKYFDGASTQ